MTLKVGNFVVRNMCGIQMRLRISKITPSKIHCGGWEFDRKTGAEIDEELGWGAPPKMTGSYIHLGPHPLTHSYSDLGGYERLPEEPLEREA